MKQYRIADARMQLEKCRENNPEQHRIADARMQLENVERTIRNSIISRMYRLLLRIGICVIIMEETRNETCNRFNRPDRGRD